MTHPGRLGLLGGTFDPIHWGHLDAAQAAASTLGLTELLFVPSHVPPHRPLQPHASGFHRLAMTALAVQDLPAARVSDMELTRPGPSYSTDTLMQLHAWGWDRSQIFFVIGTDAFAEIATWRGYPALLDLCHFAVISRAGAEPAGVGGDERVRSRLASPATLPSGSGTTCVVPIAASTRPISSSEIRARAAAGRSFADLVPPPVAAYISRQQLYRPGQQFA